ncbi:glycosyl transferase family 2 [Oleidesulfovibrio alaskensis G20]|uniref:Glycosyl transferase family 2 n=1 Tax=Oleidesulfovibrio alaskensis (strain ATCC BAA-1058 / DSM 17464 / G20) TaxID=207559 RepID=Q313H8_OLEA2|nr:glycosyltransferase [Oleidesulfovibrio alaskensis]ABB37918.1 glycosyl transferase family 2 [Oleidesulfovibrio alaskensis G20]MBG0772929.1 glycosyltransferase [Oleidesulfovibrio alaskensis]MBL3582515.1 glycosyltransferase [Oleidesulfovibrio alaskensis]
MTDFSALLRQYTLAVLPWQLGQIQADTARPAATQISCRNNADGQKADGQQADPMRTTESMLRAAQRVPHPHVLLMGLGDGSAAAALARRLPAGRTLTVVEASPEKLRAAFPDSTGTPADAGAVWWMQGRHTVLCDTSPKALVYLLLATGRTAARSTMMLNTALPPAEKTFYRQIQRLLLSAGAVTAPASPPCPPAEAVSFCAILHPQEPRLEEFFAQLPHWLTEAVIVWDADRVPAGVPQAACTVRHLARPLANDFSRQRNEALRHATGSWVLFLDGDERFDSKQWQALPAVVHAAAEHGAGGVLFPRVTFWPDKDTMLAGFGMWPDMQLRLMRRSAGLHFRGRVHEVAQGTEGTLALAPAITIRHLSRLHKDEAALAAKLAVFDNAAGRNAHRLNKAYPTLPAQFFSAVEACYNTVTLILLGPAG